MRAIVAILCLLAGAARAQTPQVGAPDAAFSGGPIKLSPAAVTRLRAHYKGDNVPLIPQPFRARLDTAFAARDWARVEAAKKDLTAAQGLQIALLWEQTRWLATGGTGIAELHAVDLAATGAPAISDSAALMWWYSVAATMTDGQKCTDPAARDAHLDKLRGPAFATVLPILRAMPDTASATMREMAIRMEAALSGDRANDSLCRDGKPDAVWLPQAASTRAMLPRHLAALASVIKKEPPPKAAPAQTLATAGPRAPEPVPPPPSLLAPAVNGLLGLDPPAINPPKD